MIKVCDDIDGHEDRWCEVTVTSVNETTMMNARIIMIFFNGWDIICKRANNNHARLMANNDNLMVSSLGYLQKCRCLLHTRRKPLDQTSLRVDDNVEKS